MGYSGWEDIALSAKGEKEASGVGMHFKEMGLKFDTVFTSVLQRANKTVDIACGNSDNESAQVIKSWRLNARHSGGLQGLTKGEAIERYGAENIEKWRGRQSYHVLPACV